MAINRYNQGRDVVSLQDEIQRMMRQAFGQGLGDDAVAAGAWSPALDVEENSEGFRLHIELPGISPDAVDVSLEDNVLTITGERSFYDERNTDDFRRVERRFGRFHRAVRLPDRVAPDRVEATYRDGILTVIVPKAEEAKPRRITVKSQ